MKFAADRPYADPEKAARKILEIANTVEAVQDSRQSFVIYCQPRAFAGLRICRPAPKLFVAGSL
jgi:hypothetical protein